MSAGSMTLGEAAAYRLGLLRAAELVQALRGLYSEHMMIDSHAMEEMEWTIAGILKEAGEKP